MRYKYQTKGYQFLTPCPHGFGWLSHAKWGPHSERPVMIGSPICSVDCPHNGGTDGFKKIVKCNYKETENL